MNSVKFIKSNPILYSTDIRASLKFCTEVLCFDQSWEWGEPVGFGGVVKDDVEIFFSVELGSPGTWIAIMLDNVDEYFELVKNKGARIIQEPKDMSFGIREMLVEGPDKHVLSFGHRIDCD
jgi:hypothetical protein